LKRLPAKAFDDSMKLADRIAQFHAPFLVQDDDTGRVTRLNNAADCAGEVARTPIRFVLADELARLCTALAYSKGARTLACADLMRVPSDSLWIEWRCEPWQRELERYGLGDAKAVQDPAARRGALFRASPDGRRGMLRTFWTGAGEDVLASSVEAYFDLDTAAGEEPDPWGDREPSTLRVSDDAQDEDVLNRCFRFRYERTWSDYYGEGPLSPGERMALWRHALGTIVIDIPVLLAFFLLLGTRAGLPQRPQCFERLNRSRLKAGKAPILDHVDVNAPLFHRTDSAWDEGSGRRGPRLHHVRGHLVRRGSQLFWRVPHVRGSARQGAVLSRTVTLSFEQRA
jgi:hypothetical protein